MDKFTLVCRHCKEVHRESDLTLIVSWYVVHIIQKHWEHVQEVHNSTNERIGEAYQFAKEHGWISE